MKTLSLALTIWFLLVLLASAQPAPSAIIFEWDHPTNRFGILAYRLQWGTQGSYALVSTNATRFTVPAFEEGENVEVSIRSVTAAGETPPTTIHLRNIPVHFQRNTGSGWKTVTSYWHTIETTNHASTLYRVVLGKPE